MSVIKAKMTELSHEINRLSSENDQMSQEESRSGILEKRAASLVKELASLDLELAIYNEFLDRIRMGDTADDVESEYESLVAANRELIEHSEYQFEERTIVEESIKRAEREIKSRNVKWEQLKSKMNMSERKRFNELQDELYRLNESALTLETRVKQLVEKKRQVEVTFASGCDLLLRKELLATLETIRSLEQQKSDLLDETNTVDEKGRLLAQVKRDNQEIVAMENRISTMMSELDEVKSDIDAYDDTETVNKYNELKKKEEAMDTFLDSFDKVKREEVNKCTTFGVSVYDVLNRITRMVSHIDSLKSTPSLSSGSKSGVNIENIIDTKRKLELDLGKIEQLEAKITFEITSQREKIANLQSDIKTYGDINRLKKEMESKSEELKYSRDSLVERINELKRSLDTLKELVARKREKLNNNETYSKMRALEARLSEVLSVNERIQSLIAESDTGYLKKRVMDSIVKHNQRLQGF